MSDTPISDSTPHNVAELGMLCRRLERKLAAANDRIKRLEEALYKIEFYAATGILQDSFDEIKRIAKESK
tara:strand:- start:52 stop:261 length:210 start_codon:yes stop_codon:yes gene_type:complete